MMRNAAEETGRMGTAGVEAIGRQRIETERYSRHDTARQN